MQIIVTLGHNASAIGLTNEGELIAGYEEERLSGKKADSNFPRNAISKLLQVADNEEFERENTLYVSHWFDDFNFDENKTAKEKHWDYNYIRNLQELYGFKIVKLSEEFTHHDAHAYAANSFYKQHGGNKKNRHIFVADGFGNKQEVISIYKVNQDGEIVKTNSFYGYEKSLGLMYQYATSFVGMEENKDEYKLLGYEANIEEILEHPERKELINDILNYSSNCSAFIYNTPVNVEPSQDGEINIDELKTVKEQWHRKFQMYVNRYIRKKEFEDFERAKRILIGFVVQKLIENMTIDLIRRERISNVTLAGGIFYNVKLNNKIMKQCQEICIYPLAGDQGAGIGLYEYKTDKQFPFENLFFGKREFDPETIKFMKKFNNLDNFRYFDDKQKLIDYAADKLNQNEIVQVVSGDMEFGPRALCHTSTLSLPEANNVDLTNKINGRSTVMPMAPIILRENIDDIYEKRQTKKVIGSDKYMILTYDYLDKFVEENKDDYRGVMHNYPLMNKYSGRPQIVEEEDGFIYEILSRVNSKALINTSYNIHGHPIAYDIEDVVRDYKKQLMNKAEENVDKEIHLLVGNFK